ncbi:MAG: hypothetical protein JNG85_12745 [Spirochaetaceae bacterium]|nr:hypothetical protein [Spirochaetaceae bacterium]
MELYDRIVEESLALLEGLPGRRLEPPAPGAVWPDAGEQNLILRGEMAYELGGGALGAVGGLALTSSAELVPRDELWLHGQDLGEIAEDRAYARLTFLRVAEGGLGEGDAAYAAIRRIENTRYHVRPKGYMARVSAAAEREPVRVGRAALAEGLDFAKVGGLFLEGYRRNPAVLAAKLVFVTLPDFPYGELARLARRAEAITESLNLILKNLKMDCASCGLKPVCDEVEGLRDLYFSRAAG